jgi:hypothetical protein
MDAADTGRIYIIGDRFYPIPARLQKHAKSEIGIRAVLIFGKQPRHGL